MAEAITSRRPCRGFPLSTMEPIQAARGPAPVGCTHRPHMVLPPLIPPEHRHKPPALASQKMDASHNRRLWMRLLPRAWRPPQAMPADARDKHASTLFAQEAPRIA